MVTETDLVLGDGRVLHVYDTAGADDRRLAVFWHHGTPNTGEPPEPLFAAAARQGIRWVSHDRPGYGTSTPVPGRDLKSTAADVASIADALGIGRFAVMGHSGGGSHALACAAMLPDRVLAVVSVAGLAPYPERPEKQPDERPEDRPEEGGGLDWFAGMYPGGVAGLRAARAGRAELEAHLAASGFDPEMFTEADHAALGGEWSWLGGVAGRASQQGPAGHIDDDLGYVRPWGVAVRDITAPALIVHGGRDRIAPSSHARWLADRIRGAELWLRPDDGHISVLGEAAAALRWLSGNAVDRRGG